MNKSRVQNKKIFARRILYVLLVLITAALQNTPHLFPSVFGCKALLIIPLVVCMAMFERIIPAMIYGLCAGMLWDITVAPGDGYNALMMTVLAVTCSAMIKYLMRNNLSSAFLLGGCAVVIYMVLHWLFFEVFRSVDGCGITILTYYLPSAVYTLLFLPVYYVIIRKFVQKMKYKYPDPVPQGS
jgi:rod shape-determining protein MreD